MAGERSTTVSSAGRSRPAAGPLTPTRRPRAALMMSEKKGRRAKIVCTLGPAVASLTGVRNLVAAGMDVARLNFSHGTHPEHAQLYHWVRQEINRRARSAGKGGLALAGAAGSE